MSGDTPKKTFLPPQASILVRSHLGTFSGDLREGDLIMEGLYIKLAALAMMCEYLPQTYGSIASG